MSKYCFVIALIFVLTACSPVQRKVRGTDLDVKVFPMPTLDRKTPLRTARILEQEINIQNEFIGTYPPNYRTESQREQIYQDWVEFLLDAGALKYQNGETEETLYLLSELYRQGHNLDVKGAAEKAAKNIEKCIENFPDSVPCHFSSMYFYPTANPKFISLAERSLKFLRTKFPKGSNKAVERECITIHLFEGRLPEAAEHIDFYLSVFPNCPDRELLLKIKNLIQSGTGKIIRVYE